MKTIPEFLSSPLAMLPFSAMALLERYRVESSMRMLPESREAHLPVDGETADRRPYSIVGGIAVVPVHGILSHDEPYWFQEATSYTSIHKMLAAAIGDEEVRGIMMHVNSPGGTVSGCFDLCDDIYDMRGVKPMWAIVDESAFSAAYAIASCADRIIVPRTGGVGSVGVITMHIDITKMLENAGIKVTTIQFGERKSDSYPTTPLSREAEKRLQAEVDMIGDLFVSLVSRNRGMDKKTVLDTEAACYLGKKGVDVGLADVVMPVSEAINEFMDEVK